MKLLSKTWTLVLCLPLVLSACRAPAPETPAATQVDPNAVYTAAAQTANAMMTQLLSTTPATATPEPSATPQPTQAEASAPTATLGLTGQTTPGVPGTAALPGQEATTAPPLLVTTPPPPGIPASTSGDRMEFVADVNVPDGTTVDPGESFTKTWRVKNSGTTTWTPQYAFAFVTGTQMGTISSIPIPVNVAPGETIDLSVDMVAPETDGEYFSYWMLKNPNGLNFGMGPNADGAIYVNIVVGEGGSDDDDDATPSAQSSTNTGTSGNSIVTGASMTVDQAHVEGVMCPYTFNMVAKITMKSSGEVTFGFDAHSDDTGFNWRDLPAGETLTLPKGTYTYNFPIEAEQSFGGYIQLHIFEPVDVYSERLQVSLDCDGGES